MKKQCLRVLVLCCALIALTVATAFATDSDSGMDADSVLTPESVNQTAALASGAEIVDSGYCGGEGDGTNLTWTLDSEGTLTISGTGKMKSYRSSPWDNRVIVASIFYGVTSIGDRSFSGCSGLKNVTTPDSVTSIGDYAFSGCSGLKNVTIPDSVTSIGDYAFSGCRGLTSVTIPDGVTSIGSSAFSGCIGLTSITIPGSVTSMRYSTFSDCTSLTNITILDGVTSIGSAAFSRCINLTGITIPDSVTSIGQYAFSGCIGLTSITIPDSVVSIGESVFAGCTSLTSITIPDSVTSIGRWAFQGCTGLTSVTIPDSVTSIGSAAFSDCIDLTSAGPIGGGYSYEFGWTKAIPDLAFNGCRSLTSITIPDSVTSIGGEAFFSCTGLTSITMPDSVTSIGVAAFANCTGLTSITIPDSVTSIGQNAFGNCTGLTSITIPDSVTSMEGACKGCSSLTSVILGNNVTSIGFCAFYDCSGLTSITIPDSVTSIQQNAFSNCTGLTSITIPDSVTSIGDYAFIGCSGLTNVTIPNSVTSIGVEAFKGCSSLTSVTIPDSVTFIKYRSFYDCSSLTSVTIGNGVTYIDGHAFHGCSSLTSVTIGSGVTFIGDSAFFDCRLKDIYYTGDAEQWNAIRGLNNVPLRSANIHYESVGPDNPPTEPSVTKRPIIFVNGGSYSVQAGSTLEITAVIPDAEQSDYRGWTKKDDAVIDLTSSKTSVADGLLYATATVQGVSPGERTLTVSAKDGRSATCTVRVLQRIEIPKDVSAFNADVYRAEWLLDIDHHATAKLARNLLNEETPSHKLCEAGKEEGLLTGTHWWNALKTVSEGVDDPTTVTDSLAYAPIEAYMAIILNTLEEISLNDKDALDVHFDAAGEALEQGGKVISDISDLASLFEDAVKSYALLKYNIPDMLRLDILPMEVKEELKNFTDDYFETCFPGVHENLEELDIGINSGVSLAGDLYSYSQKMASYYALANYGSHIKALLRELQRESQIDGDMYLKIALVYCTEIMDNSVSGMMVKIAEGGYVVGKNAFSLVWKSEVKDALYKYPLVRVWQTAYKLSALLSDIMFHTNTTVDAFAKMQSIYAVEAVADRVYQKAMSRFSASKNEENAALYLASLDFLFVLRGEDCRHAYDYVNALDGSGFNIIKKTLGYDTYASCKKDLSDLQKSYHTIHENALTSWIYALEEDALYSSLYPAYQSLLEKSVERTQKKQFLIACPVDVCVYNAENQVVAAVANGSVFAIDTIDAALLGEEKVFWFYDDQPYRMEYIGNDTGEMDISITEFGEDEEATRTVNYYGVKLETGSTYHLDAPAISSTQNPIAYELKDSVKTSVVAYDYDSALTESLPHTVKVVSGTLVHEGNSFTSTEAKKGETITLNAYVPAGYEFVRWNVTPTNAVSFNATEQSTTLIMPNQDVTVEAVLQIADTAIVRANGAQTETGSTVNAKVCCVGNSEATVYCAFYNEAGKMLNVDIKSANSGENDLSFTTTSGGVATAKLMILDNQMIPQCGSEAVEII